MISLLRGPLVLLQDVSIIPVKDLPEHLRLNIVGNEDDFTISRPRSRQTSKLISPEIAALLDHFKKPLTIAHAVAIYSHEHQLDPEKTLEEILPILRQLIQAGFLVPENFEDLEEIKPTLETEDRFAGFHLLRCIQVLDDSELHLVRRATGSFAVLKLAREGKEKALQPRLEREVTVLRLLNGRVSPELIEAGEVDGRPYLALNWCPGVDVATAGSELRSTGNRGELLQLLVNIVTAYETLHKHGVVHCDVHPGNILISGDGKVTLIDFGISNFVQEDTLVMARGGVAFFYEPEFAVALLNGRPPPRNTILGEQYSVAALLYLVATGHNYYDFSLESKALLKQVATEKPLSFQERGLEPWPQLENVLARALSKKPEQRYPDLAALASALSSISTVQSKSLANNDKVCEKLTRDILHNLQPEGKWFKDGLDTAPFCSVNMGMAGIAYALHRIASARKDPQLFALADLWIGKAMRSQDRPGAFTNEELDVTPDTIGRVSPYHTASGLMVVSAILAHATGNFAELEFAHAGFLESIDQPNLNRDLTLGSLGVVLASVLLLERSPSANWQMTDALRKAGQERLDQIWAEIRNFDSLESGKDWANLGIAHGWAGLLYATLRWHVETAAQLPEDLPHRLAELLHCAYPIGRGLSWPWRAKGRGGNSSMPGWCNGSAGIVHLGCLAHKVIGDECYFAMAEGAAWNAWEAGVDVVDLCCGLAGRAYSLLCLYQHCGDRIWLTRAQELAHRAARLSPSQYGREHPRHSLYKGELGLAVLLAEIEHPESASMPMFSEEV